MKSKARRSVDEVDLWKQAAARKLAGLTPKERARVLRQAVLDAEKEMGFKFRRFKGKMAKRRPLRRAL